MGAPAASFEVRADSAAPVVAAIEKCLREVTRPSAVVVFCTGRLAGGLLDIAEQMAGSGLPTLLLAGPGVLSERGELEGEDAATGMVWTGKEAELSLCETDELSTSDLQRLLPNPRVPAALFIRSEGFDPEQLWNLRADGSYPFVFGAGVHGDPGIVSVDAGEI